MNRILAGALVSALIYAEDEVISEGSPQDPWTNGDTLFELALGEVRTDDITGEGVSQTELWYKTTVSGVRWDDNTVVMTWFEAEDPDAPGMYIGGSCTAEYMQDNSYSSNVIIKTTYGPASYRDLASNSDNLSWSVLLAD